MSEKSLVEDGSLKVDKAKKAVFLDPKAIIQEDEMRGHQTTEMTKANVPEGVESINDVPAGSPWAESPQGKILPIENSGKVEEPLQDSDNARFANRGTPDYQGDKADFAPETLETGKKVSGHKTKSGL